MARAVCYELEWHRRARPTLSGLSEGGASWPSCMPCSRMSSTVSEWRREGGSRCSASEGGNHVTQCATTPLTASCAASSFARAGPGSCKCCSTGRSRCRHLTCVDVKEWAR